MLEVFQFLLDQFNIFYEYFDLLAILWAVAKFAFLGFTLALVVIVICIKFKLFRRQNKFWNIAAKLYFLYIPVVFIGVGVGFGLMQYIKENNVKYVAVFTQPIKQTAVNYLQDKPPGYLTSVAVNTVFLALVPRILANADISFKGQKARESFKNFINKYYTPIIGEMSSILVSKASDSLNKEISKATNLNEKELIKLKDQTVIELISGDLLDNIISQQINKVINGYQKSLLFLLLLFMLVPTVDILIAKVLKKRSNEGVI